MDRGHVRENDEGKASIDKEKKKKKKKGRGREERKGDRKRKKRGAKRKFPPLSSTTSE